MSNHEPSAVVFGCQGPTLTDWESGFFRDADPFGFILFARNCETPDQIRALIDALREAVGRADAPVLIDQEGGRVARLRPPHWRQYPAPAEIGRLGGERAREAAFLAARLIADDLKVLGVTVDCLPVLDIPVAGADPVIGDRAYGTEPRLVAELGRAASEGLLSGAVLPVIKHIPGHGRAMVDSHLGLPVVVADRRTLASSDFAPFRALADRPWAMTAHIVYRALDSTRPATLSAQVIREIIRGEIGFDGVLISDDLSMKALGGGLGERARAALAAGCDLALHCNGDQREMAEIASSITPLSDAASRRIARGEAMRRRAPRAFDRATATARLDALMTGEAA